MCPLSLNHNSGMIGPGGQSMRAFLSEADTLAEIRGCCRRATRIRVATGLITRNGLNLIEGDLEKFLARGGEIQVLAGTDMATDPEAIEALLKLQEQYSHRVTIRRFASDSAQIFHPKVWIFSFRSGPGAAIVGSSNLTSGGLGCNLEANVRLDGAGLVRELEGFFDELFEGGRAKDIGETWLDSYRLLWKQQRAVRMKLDRLQRKAKGIRTRRPVTTMVPTRIREHSFAFTGRIAGWLREAKLYPTIRRYGGTVKEYAGLNKAECLVHGDIPGGKDSTRKLRAARRDGIEVISQSEFFRILDNEQRLRKKLRLARTT
jgi:HKD family nuclease